MFTSLERVMGANVLHQKSTNSKRAPRRLILYHCDVKSLLSLRLVSQGFKRWVKAEECRYFRDIRVTLSLTDDCHLSPADFGALKLPGSIAERVILTLAVNGRGRKIEFKQRHDSGEGVVMRSSTLNPLPQEGHFDMHGQFSLMEPSIPVLGGVFKEFEDNLFRRILDMTPRVHSLCIRDKVVWGSSHRDKVDEDWGRTLVDEALIYLRCQLEGLLLDRLEEFSQVKELAQCVEVTRLRIVAQVIKSPIDHLEEMIRLARILELNELTRLKRGLRSTEEHTSPPKRPKKVLARPQLLAWLKELALITESPPARLKELARLVEFLPAQLEEALRVTEIIRLDEVSRIEGMVQTAESPAARDKLVARLRKLGQLEESLPARLESLARLEELATLAESPQARLKLFDKLSRPEVQPVSYEEQVIFIDSLEARLDLHTRLNELSRPPRLRLLEMQVSSPLALWHFRTFPGYGDSGSPLQGAGIWATIKTLNITLPAKTPGRTPGRRRAVKKGVYDFLAAFSGQVETLGIGFRPAPGGELPDSRNPLSCDGDIEFGGAGESIKFPTLKKLGLTNMQLTWEGSDGLKNFFTERAPNCISVELSGVYFSSTHDWNQLYQMFMIEPPEKKRDLRRNSLILVRKLELPGFGSD